MGKLMTPVGLAPHIATKMARGKPGEPLPLANYHPQHYPTGMSMEVIVTILSKLSYFTYLRDANNLLIEGSVIVPFTKCQQDIPT